MEYNVKRTFRVITYLISVLIIVKLTKSEVFMTLKRGYKFEGADTNVQTFSGVSFMTCAVFCTNNDQCSCANFNTLTFECELRRCDEISDYASSLQDEYIAVYESGYTAYYTVFDLQYSLL